jgi:hypothetical protein
VTPLKAPATTLSLFAGLFGQFYTAGPAGDVWVTNNWQNYLDAMGKVDEAVQTQGAGQGVVVFYGMAKPVKTPLVGPPRQP